MSTDPDQIRVDIERTRAELSSDVDALSDKVSPTQAAQRQADKVRQAATGLKERVMGAVTDRADAARDSAGTISDKASDLPQAATAKTRGNPIAAGLIAFGIGWLAASAVPSTRQEQHLARTAKDQAAPLVDQAKDAAHNLTDNLREPAQEAATALKDRATQAGTTLRDEGRDAATALRTEAGDSAQNIKGAHAANDGG
jgi:ElaB/YqjD/DUF883 family membrane-anchored ribosome-binding protein